MEVKNEFNHLVSEGTLTEVNSFSELSDHFFGTNPQKPYGWIYQLYCNSSGKSYIGLTTDWRDRYSSYKNYSCITQIRLYDALCYHGFEDFDFRILKNCYSKLELEESEIEEVKRYKTMWYQNGYNTREPGGHSGKHSEETKKKIGDSHRGEKNHFYGKKLTEEHKQKLRDSLSGERNPCYGKRASEETKKKLSESHKDKTIRSFKHKDGREFVGCVLDFKKKYGLGGYCYDLINKNNRTYRGWMMSDYVDNTPIYKFINKETGEIYEGTAMSFIKKYNLGDSHVYQIINGKAHYHKNWRLFSEPECKKPRYKLIHKSGEIFEGTRMEFMKKYNLIGGSADYALKDKNRTVKGWKLYQEDN